MMELIWKIALIVLPIVLFLVLLRMLAKQRAMRDATTDELVLHFRPGAIWLSGIMGIALPLSASVLLCIFPAANNRAEYVWIMLAGLPLLVFGPFSLHFAYEQLGICARGVTWKHVFGKTLFLPWEDIVKVRFVRNFRGMPQTFWFFAGDRRKGELPMVFRGVKDAVPLLLEHLPIPVQQKHAADLAELAAVTNSSSSDIPIEPPPISSDHIKSLFDYLDRPNPTPCGHTHKETIEFLKENGLPVVPTIAWLEANGGYCDCEIIYNVTDTWGEKVGWKPNIEEE
ncbi:MAG: DUF2695 domain-containing protein [Phycisphaerae bacterium]|jgi:hypothetical protein|nr:DUF2695 domain-containing protein [Phycisphaerae bacterium]